MATTNAPPPLLRVVLAAGAALGGAIVLRKLRGAAGSHAGEGKLKRLTLRMISGAEAGRTFTAEVGKTISVGRLSENVLELKDDEVSGRHALLDCDKEGQCWTVTDRGSLNGTRVNGREIGEPGRRPGEAVALRHGDIITVGETATMLVLLGRQPVPMGPRFVWSVRGQPSRKHLQRHEPSEDDVSLDLHSKGASVLCVMDGHCGRKAVAEAAVRLPQEILSRVPKNISGGGRGTDMGARFQEAFRMTDEAMTAEHEGCTATAIVVWPREGGCGSHLQVANVGDSTMVCSNYDSTIRLLTMTHRLTSELERNRLKEKGVKLREGESRIYGLNVSRVLGDGYLKNEDVGLTSEPSVSKVLEAGCGGESIDFAVAATDGLWDEVSPEEAIGISREAMERHIALNGKDNDQSIADSAADALIARARGVKGLLDDVTVLVIRFTEDAKKTFH